LGSLYFLRISLPVIVILLSNRAQI